MGAYRADRRMSVGVRLGPRTLAPAGHMME